jgi:hypothetical protein
MARHDQDRIPVPIRFAQGRKSAALVERHVARRCPRHDMHARRPVPRGMIGKRLDKTAADALAPPRRIEVDMQVRWVAHCQICEPVIVADIAKAVGTRRIVETADKIAGNSTAFRSAGKEGVRAVMDQITAEPALAECAPLRLVGKEDPLDVGARGIGCIITERDNLNHAVPPETALLRPTRISSALGSVDPGAPQLCTAAPRLATRPA